MTRIRRTDSVDWRHRAAAALGAALAFGAGAAQAETAPRDQAYGPRGRAAIVQVDGSGPAAFARALGREYRIYLQAEGVRTTWAFWRRRFVQKAAAADRGRSVPPESPTDWRVRGAAGVALEEARVRLLRIYHAGGRKKAPAIAARAQVSYDCWLSRAAGRVAAQATADCRRAFFDRVTALEDVVLPVRATSVFNRTLAREYAAYADYEATHQNDLIDARHFAAKARAAANGRSVTATEPEALSRWNLVSGNEIKTFVVWRKKLVRVLAVHRASGRARIAALAQARFDCWVERSSERNDSAQIQKCRGEFLGHMRQLGAGARPLRARSFTVYFPAKGGTLANSQRRVVQNAARYAIRKNARAVDVVAHAGDAGRDGENLRRSFRRAERVAWLLRRYGIRAHRIRMLHVGRVHSAVKSGAGAHNRPGWRAVIVVR